MRREKTGNRILHQQLLNHSQGAFVLALQMLGQHHEAEDVVQTSILKSLEQQSVPDAPLELKLWFYRVVRNTALDRLRSQKRRGEHFSTPELVDSIPAHIASEPDQQLEQQQLKLRLEAALAKLTLAHRELIVLRDYHHYSYSEIAQILDMPEGTVMSRLHRARLALRQCLQQPSSDEHSGVDHE
jgi:RNA polymerase sigma-70 factor (ECF subfamily)